MQCTANQESEKIYMTYKEAKRELQWYYRLLETLEALSIHRGMILIAVGSETGNHQSPVERTAVRRISIEEEVREIESALKALSDEQREFIRLRYKEEYGFRTIAHHLHRALGAMPQFERDTLAAYIAARGLIPKV